MDDYGENAEINSTPYCSLIFSSLWEHLLLKIVCQVSTVLFLLMDRYVEFAFVLFALQFSMYVTYVLIYTAFC